MSTTTTSDGSWNDGSIALPWTQGLPDGDLSAWLALPPRGPARVLAPREHLDIVLPTVAQLVGHASLARRTAIRAGVLGVKLAGARLLPDANAWSVVGSRLLAHAREVAGQPDAIGIIRLNPARPNRKPVLQLLSEDGRTTAYVKVGWDEISAELVRGETQVLLGLDAPPGLEVPQVLGHVDGAVPALAVSPFEDERGGWHHVEDEMARRAVAIFAPGSFGQDPTPMRLQDTPLFHGVSAQLDELASHPFAAALIQRRGRFLARYGQQLVATGRWHGDWSPGYVILGEVTHAWDWERSSTGAPLGLDGAYTMIAAGHAPSRAARVLSGLLEDHPNTGRAGAIVALALLVRASRHADAAAHGMRTRAEASLALLDEALAP